MKIYLSGCLVALLVVFNTPVFSANESAAVEAEQKTSEQIIEMCEEQYPADSNPNEEERYGLIDQCIETNSNPTTSAAPE